MATGQKTCPLSRARLWPQEGAGREASGPVLLAAAKLNPLSAPVFAALGTFYTLVKPAAARARKCYEKAVELDITAHETARTLSQVLT